MLFHVTLVIRHVSVILTYKLGYKMLFHVTLIIRHVSVNIQTKIFICNVNRLYTKNISPMMTYPHIQVNNTHDPR